MVAGRADEIIKIAGHRLGTIEVETVFLTHPAVAEIGRRRQARRALWRSHLGVCLLKHGYEPSAILKEELLKTVRHEPGPVAVIGEVNFVSMLPKTRSGKIMRRVLKAVIRDKDPGDITTIEDEGSLTEAREAWQQMKAELGRALN